MFCLQTRDYNVTRRSRNRRRHSCYYQTARHKTEYCKTWGSSWLRPTQREIKTFLYDLQIVCLHDLCSVWRASRSWCQGLSDSFVNFKSDNLWGVEKQKFLEFGALQRKFGVLFHLKIKIDLRKIKFFGQDWKRFWRNCQTSETKTWLASLKFCESDRLKNLILRWKNLKIQNPKGKIW